MRLEKYGLAPDKDVAIVQIGSQPARFSALESGKIHGVMIAIPLTAKAKKDGAKHSGGPYKCSDLNTSTQV